MVWVVMYTRLRSMVTITANTRKMFFMYKASDFRHKAHKPNNKLLGVFDEERKERGRWMKSWGGWR